MGQFDFFETKVFASSMAPSKQTSERLSILDELRKILVNLDAIRDKREVCKQALLNDAELKLSDLDAISRFAPERCRSVKETLHAADWGAAFNFGCSSVAAR